MMKFHNEKKRITVKWWSVIPRKIELQSNDQVSYWDKENYSQMMKCQTETKRLQSNDEVLYRDKENYSQMFKCLEIDLYSQRIKFLS